MPEVPGSFQWERITIRSADERAIRRQNGFMNVGGWRKEPLAKKNRTRLFVCGKTHLKNISLNVHDVLLGVGSSLSSSLLDNAVNVKPDKKGVEKSTPFPLN